MTLTVVLLYGNPVVGNKRDRKHLAHAALHNGKFAAHFPTVGAVYDRALAYSTAKTARSSFPVGQSLRPRQEYPQLACWPVQ